MAPDRLAARTELLEQVTGALKELHSLMEEYAPAWCPQELHDRIEKVLRSLEER